MQCTFDDEDVVLWMHKPLTNCIQLSRLVYHLSAEEEIEVVVGDSYKFSGKPADTLYTVIKIEHSPPPNKSVSEHTHACARANASHHLHIAFMRLVVLYLWGKLLHYTCVSFT